MMLRRWVQEDVPDCLAQNLKGVGDFLGGTTSRRVGTLPFEDARGDTYAVFGVGEPLPDSVEHLRPWMPWIAQEPLSVKKRRALIEEWERDWLAGGDIVMGPFVDGRVAGGCGLHHRIGAGGLEIGYWTHPAFLRNGVATSAARLLTQAALTRADVTRVEIHHDKANEASAGIPRRLGFQLVRELPDTAEAPAEIGISCEWRHTRETWSPPAAQTSTDS